MNDAIDTDTAWLLAFLPVIALGFLYLIVAGAWVDWRAV